MLVKIEVDAAISRRVYRCVRPRVSNRCRLLEQAIESLGTGAICSSLSMVHCIAVRFTTWIHLCAELLPGGDGGMGTRLAIAGENITLKENEGHNRQKGRAFRHPACNGVVA